jgi:hypothetical protein
VTSSHGCGRYVSSVTVYHALPHPFISTFNMYN